MIVGKTIFICGGSGSLGNTLIKRYLKSNTLIVYSRDENKHWNMQLEYDSVNLRFMLGDIRDKCRIKEALKQTDPDVVIIAAALKHIERCESNVGECIQTNIQGVRNVLDVVAETGLKNLETVCFVSTDKACSPVNVYGMCKAVSETLVAEKARTVPQVKFVNVRYGNVLNSRGSIIPMLHALGNDASVKNFMLTHEDMTRFIMTLDEAVDLIEFAILHGNSGETIIPVLSAMKISDLMSIYSEMYAKPVVVGSMRPGEKIHESLMNATQSARALHDQRNPRYIRIQPDLIEDNIKRPRTFPCGYDYNSSIPLCTREQLEQTLCRNSLL